MFVISAHNVVSHQHGEGVNVYYYRKDSEPPRHTDGTLDVVAAQNKPGELIQLDAQIKPGGNRVSALLDFVAADLPNLEEVRVFFDEARKMLQKKRPPLVHVNQAYGVHFNTDMGLYPQRPALFADLSRFILRFVEHPPAKSFREQTPLVVVVRAIGNGEGLSFELDPSSVQKIAQIKGSKWKNHRVQAQIDTFPDFVNYDSDWPGSMSKVLTQLDEQEILSLGGIRFVDDRSNNVLWQWPSAKKSSTGRG